mgnify:CR=1 FL=1
MAGIAFRQPRQRAGRQDRRSPVMNLREPTARRNAPVARYRLTHPSHASTLLSIVQIQERTNRLPEAGVGPREAEGKRRRCRVCARADGGRRPAGSTRGSHDEASRLFSQAVGSMRRAPSASPPAVSAGQVARCAEAITTRRTKYSSQCTCLAARTAEADRAGGRAGEAPRALLITRIFLTTQPTC